MALSKGIRFKLDCFPLESRRSKEKQGCLSHLRSRKAESLGRDEFGLEQSDKGG